MLSRHRDPIFGDEETRNGTNAPGAGPFHVHVHARLEHQQLGADQLLCRDRQIYRSSVAAPQKTTH